MVLVDHRGGNHEPDRARLFQLLDQFGKGGTAGRLFVDQLLDGLGRHVEDHAFVACRQEPADHVGAHAPQSDHSKLHVRLLQTSDVTKSRFKPVSTLPPRATS